LFISLRHPPPRSYLFPYTTLFRSPVGELTSPMATQIDKDTGRHETIAFFNRATESEPISGFLYFYRVLESCFDDVLEDAIHVWRDRKSTRLNSSHVKISYAVFCLK